MNLKTKINSALILLICSCAFGQIDAYNYKRELQGVEEQWHKIKLPNEIFSKISSNLNDLRIYGITTENDTIEASYLLNILSEKSTSNEVNFKSINNSHNEKGYFFTFKIPSGESINQIKLSFKNDNFDWKIALDGSQNQQEWFQILDNYRILSIKNERTDYQFTTINFPSANYRYLRLNINSKKQPVLEQTEISFDEISGAKLSNYPINKVKIYEAKSTQQTVVEVNLESPVPVSNIVINMTDIYDYYRPITIKYLTDSVKTEQGWHYSYTNLSSGILSSMEHNTFRFNSTVLQRLKIIIHNHDNESLHIKSLEVKGYTHELIARFVSPATYYLTYGKYNASKPNYDLNHLTGKIPDSITTISLDSEQLIAKKEVKTVEPLFKNKTWLWVLMTFIILVLGGFSLKMMQKN